MAEGVDKEWQDHRGGTISVVKLDIRVTRWRSSGECHGVGHSACNRQEESIESLNNYMLHVHLHSWKIYAVFDPRNYC